MKSPITGKEMTLKKELRTLQFRKEKFPVQYHFYLCNDSKEQFTTTELGEVNMTQVYNQYRDKFNLPFPEEIKEVREKYGLPATKMSEILGFGVNSYRNYESGEVPSFANAKLIQLAKDPKKFRELIELSDTLDNKTMVKLLQKVDQLIEDKKKKQFDLELRDYLVGGRFPDEFTGYKKPSLEKLTEMVVFFTEKLKPWKTQMNKLLFYADFGHFKTTGFSISGASYRAIDNGPVPHNYHSLFEFIANNDDIDLWTTEFSNGTGEQFKPNKDRKFDSSVFTKSEFEILTYVAEKFRHTGTKEIVDISHQEKGWKENEKGRKLISYKEYGFDLLV